MKPLNPNDKFYSLMEAIITEASKRDEQYMADLLLYGKTEWKEEHTVADGLYHLLRANHAMTKKIGHLKGHLDWVHCDYAGPREEVEWIEMLHISDNGDRWLGLYKKPAAGWESVRDTLFMKYKKSVWRPCALPE